MGLLKAVGPYSILLFVAGLIFGIVRGLWLFGGMANLLQVPALLAVAIGIAPFIKQRNLVKFVPPFHTPKGWAPAPCRFAAEAIERDKRTENKVEVDGRRLDGMPNSF